MADPKLILDDLLSGLGQRTMWETVDCLVKELKNIRGRLPVDQWHLFATCDCRHHKLRDIVHQDPFTKRAFEKPRGYPGDAVLLDYIYGAEDKDCLPSNDKVSDIGKAVYQYTGSSGAPKAVRARRKYLAQKINEVCKDKQKPNILSVACGHLREASICPAVMNKEFGEFVALDLDAESLAKVDSLFGRYGVATRHAPIKKMLTGEMVFSDLDFVYAAGLYDYLPDSIARKLTGFLFNMLNPGGKLLVANFVPDIADVGYMEAFMDWWLIYRNQAQMIDLASSVPQSKIENISTFLEENRNILFMEITAK
jgi:hypothetical protein